MTVLGVVVAMLSLSLSGAIRVYEGTEQDEEMYAMAQTAMQRITEDLTAAFASDDASFVGESVIEDGHRIDKLKFCSLAHLVFNPEKQKSGLAQIGYRLEKAEDEEDSYRLLRSDHLLMTGESMQEDREETPAFVLADRLRSLQLTYFDSQGQEFDNWQSQGEELQQSAQTAKTAKAEETAKTEGAKEAEQAEQAEESKTEEAGTKGKLPAAVHCILEFWVDQDQESTQIFSTRIILPVGVIGGSK